MPIIQLSNCYKRYPGGRDALSDITFSLEKGEMAFVTGHSGAGKSTLLKLIAMMERPTRGAVLIDQVNVSRIPSRRIPEMRRKLGIIFQNYRLLYDRTVFDNVALPCIISGLSDRETGSRVRAALDKVGLLGKEKLLPATLSGGEQQRVSIARAVANRPPLLLADEPTGNLDPELSREIMHLFREFQQVGVSVLVVTHDLALVERMGLRTLALKHGKLVEDRPAVP